MTSTDMQVRWDYYKHGISVLNQIGMILKCIVYNLVYLNVLK